MRVEDSVIGDDVTIGHTHACAGSKIGRRRKSREFRGDKKSTLGAGTKRCISPISATRRSEKRSMSAPASSRSDYDGTNKFSDNDRRDAFIGSDSQLIRAGACGKRRLCAAGSTITEDVPAESLAIGGPSGEQGESRPHRKKNVPLVVRGDLLTTADGL
jgi:bifunctional UDP-N-acetylglucosamine pyrophosphorylase/glucosamine-1-phosphate N-acetyltransferase